MAIDCSSKSGVFRPYSCYNFTVDKVCQCSRPGFNGTSANFLNWIQCSNHCAEFGLYLSRIYFDPDSTCTALGSTSGLTWIGMAKTVFLTTSLGYSYSLVWRCLSCKNGTCSFGFCSEKKFAICEKRNNYATSSTTTTTTSATLGKTTQTTEPMHHTSPFPIQSQENKQDILRDTLLAVGGCLIIVLVITAIVIIYLRKRYRKTTKDRRSTKGPTEDLPKQLVSGDFIDLQSVTKSESGDHVYYNSRRQACQLDTGTQSNPTKSKGQYKSLENSQEGQTYDRLWQTSPSSSTADDTYSHAADQNMASSEDTYNHGVVRGIADQNTAFNDDDTYNHMNSDHHTNSNEEDPYNHMLMGDPGITGQTISSVEEDTYSHIPDSGPDHVLSQVSDDTYIHTLSEANNGSGDGHANPIAHIADDTYNHAFMKQQH
ncbi:uncharacterized protein LOC111121528 [Crassostrea virginica]